MTSPRQRKKRLALLKLKQKREKEQAAVVAVTVQKPALPVAKPAAPVVESEAKQKKPAAKIGLVETKSLEENKVVDAAKSQDQVVEQPKQEVKPSSGE